MQQAGLSEKLWLLIIAHTYNVCDLMVLYTQIYYNAMLTCRVSTLNLQLCYCPLVFMLMLKMVMMAFPISFHHNYDKCYLHAIISLVLRSKLSTKLDACVMDRPCPEECVHKNKQVCQPVLYSV